MTGLKDIASKLQNIEPEMNIVLRHAGLGDFKIRTGVSVPEYSSKLQITPPDPAKYPTPPPDFRSAFQIFPYWIWYDIIKPQAKRQDLVAKMLAEFEGSPGEDSRAAPPSVSSEASSPRDDFASLRLPDMQSERELPGAAEDSTYGGHDTTFESSPTFESDFSSTFGTSGSTFAPTKFG